MPVYSLTELNQHIRQTLEDAYPEALWIRAEIAGFNLNAYSGHCYLELADGQGQSAKARAMIWKKTFDILNAKFRIQTGSGLAKGMQVQILVNVEFNVQYGLSLIVWDIDATYTMGEMAVRKVHVVNQLKSEGLFDRNKSKLPGFPLQRIAVVSSAGAAGYEDFLKHLHSNEYGFAFATELVPAQMQGKEAPESIALAFQKITQRSSDFDVVVLIRGGGSSLDLQAFDEYPPALAICQCPLPVFTGIGHERDESVCDQVAFEHFKTPTAVANYLIDEFLEADSVVSGLVQSIAQNLSWALRTKEQAFESALQQILNKGRFLVNQDDQQLVQILHRITRNVEKKILQKEADLNLLQMQIQQANPAHLLKKGYARIFQEGKRKKSKQEISVQHPIVLQLQDGFVDAQPIQKQ